MDTIGEKNGQVKNRSSADGQVMVLTIVTLGGVLMGATAIAGLLLIYQIRQAADLSNSVKAIFAADTASDWGLFQYGCMSDPAKNCAAYGKNGPLLANGARMTVVCYDKDDKPLPDCVNDPLNPVVCSIQGQGSAGKSTRAFLVNFKSEGSLACPL